MEAKNILDMLLNYTGLKILPFSKKVNQGSQTFYDIRSEKIQTFSADVASKIVKEFPEINLNWILGNSKEMLQNSSQAYTNKHLSINSVEEVKEIYQPEPQKFSEKTFKKEVTVIPAKAQLGLQWRSKQKINWRKLK